MSDTIKQNQCLSAFDCPKDSIPTSEWAPKEWDQAKELYKQGGQLALSDMIV